MARIRTIKPEFFTSEDIVALSPLARILYIATWCEADKEGRFNWKPKTFKLRYLPADKCDAEALGRELTESGLVVLYGDGLAFIPRFSRHQHLNPRESPSLLPDPKDFGIDACRRVPTREDASILDMHAQGGREGKGREGKGKEGKDIYPTVSEVSDSLGFDEFWQLWPSTPRKAAKAQCAAKWTSRGLEEKTEAVVSALKTWISSREWSDPTFIPAPLVWLNQDRWEAPAGAALSPTANFEPVETMYQRAARERMEEFAPSAARKRPSYLQPINQPTEVFDVSAKFLG